MSLILSLSHRDGSAVELVGLCYSAVTWLGKLFNQGVYPYSGVKLPSEEGGEAGVAVCLLVCELQSPILVIVDISDQVKKL